MRSSISYIVHAVTVIFDGSYDYKQANSGVRKDNV